MWDDDQWIIESKSYEPYYIVDGQQRITTTIVLIQAITELYDEDDKLNYTKIVDIKKRFIFDSKDDGISRSYIFGYEKDNPSYDFLKRSIFLEDGVYSKEDTIYTHNLEFAKQYFIERLILLDKSEVEVIYKKVTQHLLFNIYTIASDVDVFVAFETMNNRGKSLSNLELLKNRLIYLSTKFNVDANEKGKLRKDINDAWKSIYHYLGKNRFRPLNDDVFLLNHFIVYFGHEIGSFSDDDSLDLYKSRRNQTMYKSRYEAYLLEDKFSVKNIVGRIREDEEEDEEEDVIPLTVQDVHNYVNSLQKSVEVWYNIFNPIAFDGFSDEEKIWFEKLSRIGTRSFWPLLLVCYQKKIKPEIRVDLLRAIEYYSFMHLLMSFRHYPELFDFSSIAIKISKGSKSVPDVIKMIDERVIEIYKGKHFVEGLSNKFKSEDYYNWIGIRYFLFEYEQELKSKTKSSRDRVNWFDFSKELDDFITVEHIYPQTPRSVCWTKNFNKYSLPQRKVLNNSLGNLLPLSKAKNSSLQNKCFADKIDNDNLVGFRYGSYSEIEVSKKADWTPRDILERGIKLLDFMEQRWGIVIGDRDKKIKMLGLEFMKVVEAS